MTSRSLCHPSMLPMGSAFRRMAVGLAAAAFIAIMFMPSATASAESGEILSPAQNGFAAGTRWHDFFCIGDEVCETGDVNADGRDDIVAFVRSSGTVWVALSEGTRFGPSSIWARGFCTGLRDCQVDDVTGDGRADAIWFDHTTGTMAFAPSTGTSFGSVHSHREPNCTLSAACTTGDVDGDRDADIVVFSRITAGAADGRVHVSLAGFTCPAGPLRFDAFGRPLPPPPCVLTYGAPRQWHDHFCIWYQVCRVADLNGDGREDLAAFMQNPAGTVYTALSSTSGPRFEANDTAGRDLCAPGSYCETGDFNGDGRHDLVSFAQRYTGADDFREPLPGGDVFTMLARPDGALTGVDFGDVSLRIRPFCLTDAVCRTGDFNGDGKDDLVSFARDRALASRGDVHVALSDFGKTTDWRLSAEGLRVVRAEDSGGDEPYLELISYRATVGISGSAEVNISRLTPGAMPATIAEFDDVRLPTVGELLAGAPLEVMGTIVIAFDDDGTSQDLIDIVIGRVATALEEELVRIVERGSVINFATNPAALTDGLAAAERNIRAAARPSDFEAVVAWAYSYFDLDDLIGVRVYTYIAVDKEVAALMSLRNDANATSGVLGETLASHGNVTRAFQCLESDCRVSPSVRYDVTIGMHPLP